MLTLGRIVAALISGALLAQAYSLNPFWPLAWIAPIPLLIAAMGAARWSAFGLGALAGALSTALMFSYLLELSGPVATIVIVILKALIWGGVTLTLRASAHQLPAWAAVFVFPTLMAGIETLTAAVSPHGTASSLAYSQMDFLPAIQAASLGGVPAIVFVVTLFGSAVVLLLAKRAFVAAIVPAMLIAGAVGWGVARVPIPITPVGNEQILSVALLGGDDFDFEAADWRPTWESYANAAERALQDGARVVVIPEKIVTIQAPDQAEAVEQLAALARRYNAVIVAGVVAEEGERAFNRAHFVTAHGARVYDKRHMIPGFESHFTPGGGDLFTDVGAVRMGVAICKDMDFPALGRRYGHQSVAVMLVPAWDFERDAWLHSRMAILRGVESGFSIIRSARDGVMTVSDPYGYVSAEAASGGDVTTLTTTMPTPRHVPTLYVRIGDAFGWACVALALLLIGWTVMARRRAGQGG